MKEAKIVAFLFFIFLIIYIAYWCCEDIKLYMGQQQQCKPLELKIGQMQNQIEILESKVVELERTGNDIQKIVNLIREVHNFMKKFAKFIDKSEYLFCKICFIMKML